MKNSDSNNLSLSMRRKGRNCDLDLSLFSPANYYQYHHHTTNSSSPAAACTNSMTTMEGGGGGSSSTAAGSPQPLTIFFNGRVCVSDVTELQARAILCHARREMDERMNTSNTNSPSTTPCSSSVPASPSLLLQSPTTNLNMNDISMKRSLQRFLQKRKNRIQSISSPYNKQ